ncbi:MAG: YciI family protein [Actinomycetota bacterium]
MRYLFAVIASQSAVVSASSTEMAAIDAFNDKIEAAGQRVMAAGVASPDAAIVFDNRDGRALVAHGPVIDADDFMAGFWVIEAENDDVAHALAAEASLACNRRIEVRPFLR